jgi:hypothetical protein
VPAVRPKIVKFFVGYSFYYRKVTAGVASRRLLGSGVSWIRCVESGSRLREKIRKCAKGIKASVLKAARIDSGDRCYPMSEARFISRAMTVPSIPKQNQLTLSWKLAIWNLCCRCFSKSAAVYDRSCSQTVQSNQINQLLHI